MQNKKHSFWRDWGAIIAAIVAGFGIGQVAKGCDKERAAPRSAATATASPVPVGRVTVSERPPSPSPSPSVSPSPMDLSPEVIDALYDAAVRAKRERAAATGRERDEREAAAQKVRADAEARAKAILSGGKPGA